MRRNNNNYRRKQNESRLRLGEITREWRPKTPPSESVNAQPNVNRLSQNGIEEEEIRSKWRPKTLPSESVNAQPNENRLSQNEIKKQREKLRTELRRKWRVPPLETVNTQPVNINEESLLAIPNRGVPIPNREVPIDSIDECILIRHGNVFSNVVKSLGKITGAIAGHKNSSHYVISFCTPLTNFGVISSIYAGYQLKTTNEYYYNRCKVVYTSALPRAIETALYMFPQAEIRPVYNAGETRSGKFSMDQAQNQSIDKSLLIELMRLRTSKEYIYSHMWFATNLLTDFQNKLHRNINNYTDLQYKNLPYDKKLLDDELVKQYIGHDLDTNPDSVWRRINWSFLTPQEYSKKRNSNMNDFLRQELTVPLDCIPCLVTHGDFIKSGAFKKFKKEKTVQAGQFTDLKKGISYNKLVGNNSTFYFNSNINNVLKGGNVRPNILYNPSIIMYKCQKIKVTNDDGSATGSGMPKDHRYRFMDMLMIPIVDEYLIFNNPDYVNNKTKSNSNELNKYEFTRKEYNQIRTQLTSRLIQINQKLNLNPINGRYNYYYRFPLIFTFYKQKYRFFIGTGMNRSKQDMLLNCLGNRSGQLKRSNYVNLHTSNEHLANSFNYLRNPFENRYYPKDVIAHTENIHQEGNQNIGLQNSYINYNMISRANANANVNNTVPEVSSGGGHSSGYDDNTRKITQRYTVKQLKLFAKHLNIKLRGNEKKIDIVNKLLIHLLKKNSIMYRKK